jgi:ribonuclease HI
MKIDLNKAEIEILTDALKKIDARKVGGKSEKILKGLREKLHLENVPQLYIDGAADLHSKQAGIGGVFILNGQEINSFSKNIGHSTNNEAEYKALITGLKTALKNKINKLQIFADSELVVKQINGEYKVKNERMQVLHKEVASLLAKFSSWELQHVRRELNKTADKYAKAGMLNK